MTLYWSAFEFSFSLDTARLLPYLAAIQACKSAASTRIVPPQWQQSALPQALEVDLRTAATLADGSINAIQIRKYESLMTNSSPAHRWVKERFAPGSAPMSLDDIFHIHRRVTQETGIRYDFVGTMRTGTTEVITGKREAGKHVGAPAFTVPRLMEQYIRFINSGAMTSMPPAIHALVGHFFLTTIHPFTDGNGRVARLVTAAILFQRGYGGHGFYAIWHHFYANEVKYHRLLLEQQQLPCPDLTEFVAFGLEGLTTELQGINRFLRLKLQRNVRRDRWLKKHRFAAQPAA